jgi:hypothetical protein
MSRKIVFSVVIVAVIVLLAMNSSFNDGKADQTEQLAQKTNETIIKNVTVVSEPVVLAAPVSVEASQLPEENVTVNITESRSYPPQFQLTVNNSGDKNTSISVNSSGYPIVFQVLANRKLTTWVPIKANMQSGSVSLRIKVWADDRLIFDEMKDLNYGFSGSSSGGSDTGVPAVTYTVKPTPTGTYTPKPTPTIPPGDYC